MTLLAWWCLLLALIPAWFYSRNLFLFTPPGDPPAGVALPTVAVLVPARNESQNIEDCLRAVLASQGVDLEVLVLDDHSEDDTAALVQKQADSDPRVRLIHGVTLPAGWNGKQHACSQLGRATEREVLVFLDADVRLEPDAVRRAVYALRSRGVDLLGGFPRQLTESWLERLLIPLILFVLLGYLSLRQMRRSFGPAWAAGCGQLFITNRSAYLAAGGHAAVRASRHDGITLPRAYRRAGLRTDVLDASQIATCRMYRGSREVWNGLAKNATEGAAAPRTIVPVTLLLVVGQVAPAVGLVSALAMSRWTDALFFAGAWAVSVSIRLHAAARFGQPISGAVWHPVGVATLLVLQWWALVRSLLGLRTRWRGRSA